MEQLTFVFTKFANKILSHFNTVLRHYLDKTDKLNLLSMKKTIRVLTLKSHLIQYPTYFIMSSIRYSTYMSYLIIDKHEP